MDFYNLMTKIPYLIMLGMGVAIVLQINIGGLNNLILSVDTGPQTEYDKALIIENILSVELDSGELEAYENPALLKTRGFVPIDLFTDGGDLESSSNNGHCYIPRVQGLDGEEFAFFVSKVNPDRNYPDLDCNTARSDFRFASVIAVDENGEKYPLRVHVYEVG